MNDGLNLNENLEIKKALKEFEMENVEQEQEVPSVSKNLETPKMIQLVIKYSGGSIKNEKQAQYVLLGLVVVIIIITIILLLNAFRGPSEAPAGFRGNIPNTPEYQNPPRPEDFQ